MKTHATIVKAFFGSIVILVMLLAPGVGWGQSYLGLDGGFEGTATIDNTVYSSAQANKWVKNNAAQTIADETSIVRSGGHSLLANNGTTGRRIWSPLITVSSTTSNVTLQFHRLVTSTTNAQESQFGIGNGTTGTETLSGTYGTPPTTGTWEKVTYTKSSWTYTNIASVIITRQIGTGGNVYIDDVAMYLGSVDITAPNAPGTVTVNNATQTSLDVSWGAASGGVDNGGYLVIRYTSNPYADNDPNQNGIYAIGNTTTNGTGSLIGTIRYTGTGTLFTDVGLSAGTQYWYKVYTFDKAYNYSTESSNNGTTSSSSTNYYLKSGGTISTLADWGTNTAGTTGGPAPALTSANIIWNLRNNANLSCPAAWTLGTGSKIIVGDGSNVCNFTIPAGCALTGTVDMSASATMTVASTTSNITLGSWNTASTVAYTGTSTQTVAPGSYGNLSISTTGGNATAGGTIFANTLLTVSSGSVFDMGTNNLSIATATYGTGTLKTQNTTSTPLPSGTTWSMDVLYNSTSPQTVVAGNYNNLNITGGNRTLINGGTIGIAGSFTPGAGVFTVTGSTVNFNGSGPQTIPAFSYNNLSSSSTGARTLAGSGTIYVAGTFAPGSNAYTVTGSTVQLTATSGTINVTLPTVSSGNSFNILTINGSGGTFTLPYSASTQNLATTLNIQAGTFVLNPSSSSLANKVAVGSINISGGTLDDQSTVSGVSTTLQVSSAWNQTAGIVTNTGTGIGLIQFTGGGATTYTGLTASTSFKYFIVQVSNSTTTTLASTLTMNLVQGDNLTVDALSTLNAAAYVVTASVTSLGSHYIAGTFKTSNLNGFSGTTTSALSSTNTPTITLVNTSTIEYTAASGTQTISARSDYANLTVSGAGTFTFAGTTTLTGIYTQSAGTATLVPSGTSAFTLSIGGDFILSGAGIFNLLSSTSNGAAATVTVTGNTTTSGTSGIYMETVNNSNSSGIAIFQTTKFTTTSTSTNIVNFGASSAVITGNEFRVGGDFDKSGTGTFNTTSTNSATGFVFSKSGIQTFKYSGANSQHTQYVVNSGSTLQLLTDLTMGSGTDPLSKFTVNGILDIGTNVISGTTNPTFTVNSGGTIKTANTGGLNSSITTPGTNTFSPTANYIFNGTSDQVTGAALTSANNIDLANTAGKVSLSNGIVVSGTVTVPTGNKLGVSTYVISGTGGNFNLQSGGTLYTANTTGLNGSITVTGTKTFDAAANYIFNGTAGSQVTGALLPGNVNNLTIDNTAGVTLTNGVTVNGILNLANGILTTGSSNTVTASGTVSRTAGHVNGNLQKAAVNGTNLFEVGSTVYAPTTITMSGVSGTVTLTAKVTNGNPSSGSGINQAAKCNHYWTVTKTGAGTFTNYNALFDFTNTTNTGTTANYKVREYSGSWASTTSSVTGTTITATGLTGFSDFEVGESDPAPIVTTQPGNSIICAGSNTSFTAASTSTPTPSVKWQRDAGSGFVDITASLDAGTTYGDFLTGTLTLTGSTTSLSGYHYQAVFTNIDGTVNSNTVTLTVNAVPSVNVGGSVTAICQGGTTAALGGSFGGGATAAVWSDGGAGGTFFNNTGSTPGEATYKAAISSVSPVTLTLTTSGGSCGTTYDTKTVTVNPLPSVNVGGPVSSICQGSTTAALDGSFGGGATAAVWSDGGAGGTFYNNTGSTPGAATYKAALSSVSPVTLTLTTSGGSCSTAYDTKQVTVTPNLWTGGSSGNWEVPGNWCNGAVPTGSTNVKIPVGSTVTVTSLPATNAACNNLIIENNTAVLIIGTGKALTVNGTITNNSDETGLVVESGGSLIQNSAVLATVERWISGWGSVPNHGWHFLSSPVSAQVIETEFVPSQGSTPTTTEDFYTWWEPTNQWVNYKNTVTSPTWKEANGNSLYFTPGKGYLVDYEVGGPKHFTDKLNKDNIPVSNLPISTGPGGSHGWHLLGNPFSSAIEWGTGDWSINNINATAKIWEETSASYVDIDNISPHSPIIPALNGFMVQVTNGFSGDNSLIIPTAARLHNTASWYKSTDIPYIVLVANDPTGQTAQKSILRFDNQATTGFDPAFDSHFLEGYAPKFYSVAGEEHLSTNTLPEVGGTVQVPFAFIKNDGVSFTIEAKKISNLYGPVILNDLKTSATQDITANPVYSFTSESGDNPNRFLLTFSHVGIGDTQKSNTFTVYTSDNRIFVLDNTGKSHGNVFVYNMVGQLILQQKLNGGNMTNISLDAATGYYLVKVVTNEQTYSTKIFINK